MRGTTMLRAFSYVAVLLFLVGLSAMPSHAACGAGGLFNTPYLVFGTQLVGQSGLTQTATLTFGTGCPATISNISLSIGGTNPGDFSAAGNGTAPCNAETSFTLVPGENASCTIGATFTPTATGTRTATITVNYTVTGAFNVGPSTVNLVGGDEVVYVTTGAGGQVLTVDGTTGAFQVLSNAPPLCDGPCPFNPTGAVVGPDGKIYVTDQVNSEIWRMNQDGSQLESVYQGGSCPDSSPCKVEGPSFSASGAGDLYFNTYYNDGIFVIPGVGNTPFGGEFSPPASVNTYASGGTGTAFDANGNLLAADVEYGAVWTIPSPYSYSTEEPAQLINYATTIVVPESPAGIALNKFTGQVFVADPEANVNEVPFNGIMQVVPPVLPSTAYTTTPYYAFTSESACDSPDEAQYIQFDMTGHLFATTSTSPISFSPAGNGCGKVWRIDPGSTPTPTLLLDLYAVYTNGIAGVCPPGECGLNASQAIGVAIGPTQGPTQSIPLLPTGGTYSAGVPAGCTTSCSSTITGLYPPGIYSVGDTMNITFSDVTQAQCTARFAGTPYSATTCAPVAGWNGDTLIPTLVCLKAGAPCDDVVTAGTAYEIDTTWLSTQTGYCGLIPHLLRGDPPGASPYTFLQDTIFNCTDPGTKGHTTCTSSSSSTCASDWINAFGAMTGPTAGIVATATITSPAPGAEFLLNQPATTTFACGQSPAAPPSIYAPGVPSCPGIVTNPAYPGTVLSATSGTNGGLPTSLVGTNTLTVSADVDGGSTPTGGAVATVTYTVVACHYVSFAFNPDPVAVGKFTMVTATLDDCAGTTQSNAVVEFMLSGPEFPKTLVFKTGRFTLKPGTETITFPLFILPWLRQGTYTVTAETFVNVPVGGVGTLVDTSSSSLIVN